MEKPFDKETRVHQVARRGVRTYGEVAAGLSALMADVLAGRVTPGKANRFCAEVGRVLAGKRKTGR